MRKHEVKCKIEGEFNEVSSGVQMIINKTFVNGIEKILKNSNLTPEEKNKFIDEIVKKVKNYLPENK